MDLTGGTYAYEMSMGPGPHQGSSAVAVSVNSPGNGLNSSKQRLRWTTDLHDKFVEAVTQLGGADRATPKAVLRAMKVQGLTIYHVKSHLQKYRLAKYVPDSVANASRSDLKEGFDSFSKMDSSSGIEMTAALQMQLEVQKRLHQQIEVQRHLQIRIEAQSRYLQKILEEQQKSSNPTGSGRLSEVVDHIPTDSDDPSQTMNTKEEMSSRELAHRLYSPYDVCIPIPNSSYIPYIKACPENQVEPHNAHGSAMPSGAPIPLEHEYHLPESLAAFTSQRVSKTRITYEQSIMHSDTPAKMDAWSLSQSLLYTQHAAVGNSSSLMSQHYVESHVPNEILHDDQPDVPHCLSSLYTHDSNDHISAPNNISDQ